MKRLGGLLHVGDIAGRGEAPAENCGGDADRDPLQQRRHAEHCAFDMKAGLALAEFDRVRKHRPEHEIQTDAHDLHADEEQLGCEGAVEANGAEND